MMLPEDMQIVDYEGKVLDQNESSGRLMELKDLISDKAKLKDVRKDDAYLLRFLHSCKFNVENACNKMESFCDLLVEYPEWFRACSPKESEALLHKNMRFILPGKDKEGRTIYLCKIGNVDPSKVSLKELVRIDDMWLESAMDDPITQSHGFSFIIDVSGYSWKLFQWLTPGNIKFGLRKIESLPIKDMNIHVVNTSFLLDASVKLVWPFLNAALKKSIKFHYDDMASLHKYISPDVLPPEYGGTASVNYEKLNEKLLEQNSEIVDKTKYINFYISGKV